MHAPIIIIIEFNVQYSTLMSSKIEKKNYMTTEYYESLARCFFLMLVMITINVEKDKSVESWHISSHKLVKKKFVKPSHTWPNRDQ